MCSSCMPYALCYVDIWSSQRTGDIMHTFMYTCTHLCLYYPWEDLIQIIRADKSDPDLSFEKETLFIYLFLNKSCTTLKKKKKMW